MRFFLSFLVIAVCLAAYAQANPADGEMKEVKPAATAAKAADARAGAKKTKYGTMDFIIKRLETLAAKTGDKQYATKAKKLKAHVEKFQKAGKAAIKKNKNKKTKPKAQ